MVTIAGCETAGYSVEQVAPLFREAYSFGNVYVPASFMPYILWERGPCPAKASKGPVLREGMSFCGRRHM